jgi:hypothetical protein
METIEILYKEAQERMNPLESASVTDYSSESVLHYPLPIEPRYIQDIRIKELTLAIVRMQQLMLQDLSEKAKLSFGDLKEGDKFIGFPLPGDNSGYGGYKGTHYIYVKTTDTDPKTMGGSNAIKLSSGHAVKFLGLMNVIKIE